MLRALVYLLLSAGSSRSLPVYVQSAGQLKTPEIWRESAVSSRA